MNFEPLLNLLGNYEKSIVKAVLVNFAPIYIVLYLFFEELKSAEVIASIIITTGVSLLFSLFLYLLVFIAYGKYLTGMTIAISSAFCIASIVLGYLSGFRISTLVIGVCATTLTLVSIAIFRYRKGNSANNNNVD